MSQYGSVETDGLLANDPETQSSHKGTTIKPLRTRSKATVVSVVLLLVVAAAYFGQHSFHNNNNIESTQALLFLSSVDVAMVGATKKKTSPPNKSPDEPLTDDQYQVIVDANESIDGITDLIDSFPNESSSPTEVMNFFQDAVDEIGAFVPGFALVGSALRIFGLFIPSESKPDPVMDFMEERFDRIDAQLAKLYGQIKELKLDSCKSNLETFENQYIDPFEGNLKILKNLVNSAPTRKLALDQLVDQCRGNDNPYHLLIQYKKIFASKSDQLGCFTEILTDTSNRVGYFRTEWTLRILSKMMKAVEYEGICLGLLEDEVSSQVAVATSPDCPGLTTTECNFKLIHEAFVDAETKMYQSPPRVWIKKFDSYNFANQKEAYWTLREEFFPDFLYAVVDVENGDSYAAFSEGTLDYGALRRGKFIIVFRSNKNKDSLPTLTDKWKNKVCPGSMCNRKEKGKGKCKLVACDSWWHQMNENTKWNNMDTYNQYRNQGVWMIKGWASDCYGDGICDKFRKKEGSQYWFFVGVKGGAYPDHRHS